VLRRDERGDLAAFSGATAGGKPLPARMSGRLSEASLPSAFLGQGQEALGGDALVGRDAEEAAGRNARVFGKHLKVRSGGEAFAQFPQIDGVRREAEVGGNLLEGKVVLLSPGLERQREGGVDVALEFGLFGHGGSLGDIWAESKRWARRGR